MIRITQNTSNNSHRAYASSQDMESGLDKKRKYIQLSKKYLRIRQDRSEEEQFTIIMTPTKEEDFECFRTRKDNLSPL